MKKSICLLISALILFLSIFSCTAAYADGSEVPSTEALARETETITESVKQEDTQEDTNETISASVSAVVYPEKGVDTFLNYSFPILVYGMLGIFLVLGLIAISIFLLGKIPSKDDEKK